MRDAIINERALSDRVPFPYLRNSKNVIFIFKKYPRGAMTAERDLSVSRR